MRQRILALFAVLVSVLTLSGVLASPAHAATTSARYAALGDSYAAGLGAGTPLDACGRSAQAYPVRLAGGTDKVTFLACSGAGLSATMTQVGLIPASARQVTLTVGGNDLNFAATLAQCAAGQCPSPDALAAKLASVPAGLGALIAAIHQQAPQATIFVTGYPLLFQPKVTYVRKVGVVRTCPVLDPVPVTTLVTIDQVTATLNAAIAATAFKADRLKGYDVRYVDVTGRFLGHGVCWGAASWINPPVLTPQGYAPASLHPTAQGQQAYAQAIKARGFKS